MHTTADIPFKFELPFEVFHKAGEVGKERRIGGIISTDRTDRQGEQVLQDGLDFSEFINNGWFNDNHSKDTTGIVGYPIKIEKQRKNGRPVHYVEGYLLENFEPADKIWTLANSLQKTGRRLGFSIEGSVTRRAGNDGRVIASAKVRNVAITNCFPGDTVVCGAGEDVMRRYYSGPMVEIHLATGEKLTGTPNHPIFTQRGWVALGQLNKVHDRVGRFNGNAVLPTSISHNVDNVPSMMEEIFNLSRLASASSWVGLARERQFHGDGLGSDVDVVQIYSHLRSCLESAFFQKFGQDALAASDKQLPLLSDEGFFDHFFVSRRFASASFVSAPGQFLSLRGGSGLVPEQLLFVPGSSNAVAASNVEYGFPSHAKEFSDCGRALSSAIGFSNITLKRRFEFSGHVFNLQSKHGWYEANGIIAHNCPVNTDTGLEVLAKSLAAVVAEGDLERGLVAGAAISAPAPVPGEGFPLRTESMEVAQKQRRRRKKKLTKAEAIQFLKSRYQGMTDTAAERILRFAAKHTQQEEHYGR